MILQKDATELTGTAIKHHSIHTGDAPPIKCSRYKALSQIVEEIEKQIRIVEDSGYIEPSTSECCHKKSGSACKNMQ